MRFNSKILILTIVVTVILYSIFIMYSDLNTLYYKITNFKKHYVPIIMILIAIGWFLFFKRWDMLLKNIGIKVPLKSNLGIFFSGFAMGFTPGRLGELFKSQTLKNIYGISRSQTAPLVIIERLYDTVGAIASAAIGVIFLPVIGYVIAIPTIIVAVVFVVFSSRSLFKKFLNIVGKINFLTRLLEPISESYDTVRVSTRGRIAVYSSLLSVANWLVTSLAVYLIVISYGVNNLSYLQIVPAFTTSSLLGAVSFIPGGVGVTEGSLAGFLTFFHVNISSILVLTVLIRIFTLWYGVIVGFIALKVSKAMSANLSDINNS